MFKSLFVILCLLALPSCALVPGRGPLALTIAEGAQNKDTQVANYHFIAINEDVVSRLADHGRLSLSGRFGNKQAPTMQNIAVGDVLSITIFESAPNGLFSTGTSGELSGARQVTLPPQVVDQSGFIDIPFGGRFKAAGNSMRALSGSIERSLIDRAIEPQVLVSTVESTSNTVTVLGEASRTGQIYLSPRGDLLLDVLAKAGAQVEESEAVIRLVRGKEIETVPLRTIINLPSENIYVLPGDTIFVLREPQVFNAMGAVQSAGQYPITFADQTIAGALSLAGGLSPAIADRGGVFIFRFETVKAARQLLPEGTQLKITPMGVPVVYQVSFLDPSSFFWLQQINIRNKDLIYVANAVVTELDKFIGIAARTNLLGL